MWLWPPGIVRTGLNQGASAPEPVRDRPHVKWASPGRCGSCEDLGRRRRYEDLLGGSLIRKAKACHVAP